MVSFQEKVYSLCKKIPKGKVTTYKIIGRKLGKRGQIYRAVGRVLNKNPHKSVPCHRVIKSDGSVGGFAKGTKKKIQMLRKEGIEIKNNKINLKKYLFKI
jgi:methylated-DNA-[protein]-cysteine S-methyltransferase